jgi:DNA-directed RNA polymerase subunit H
MKKKGIDVLKHELVPKHEVLSPEEAKRVIEQYGRNPYLFPYISASDPVIQALGAKVGDVIMITRKSETSLQTKYYRVVVER